MAELELKVEYNRELEDLVKSFEEEINVLEDKLNYKTKNVEELEFEPIIRYIYEPKNVGKNLNKANRIVTIAFNFDHFGNIKYGATIYKRENSKDVFFKNQHRQTAINRLKNNPNHFKVENFDELIHKPHYLSRMIRQQIYVQGVEHKK